MAGKKGRSGRPREYTEAQATKLGQDILDWFIANPDKFTIESWVVQCGDYFMSSDKLRRLTLEYPTTYGVLHRKIVDLQAERMAMMTSTGNMPPALGIFLLKNRGYSDKQEVAHSGSMGIELTITPVSDDNDLDD